MLEPAMQKFYNDLTVAPGMNAAKVAVVRGLFEEQELMFVDLANLTNAKLEKIEVDKLGTRERILTLLGLPLD